MARTTQDLTAPAKDARSFDRWFFSLPRKQQEKLRDSGVLPYREMRKSPDYVFEVKPDHRDWATTDNQERTEVDSFISREHVGQMLKAFFDGLSFTDDLRFRRHVELVRWALCLPGCLSSRQIGKMHGQSHTNMKLKAKAIRAKVNMDAMGLFPHVNSRRNARQKSKGIFSNPPGFVRGSTP